MSVDPQQATVEVKPDPVGLRALRRSFGAALRLFSPADADAVAARTPSFEQKFVFTRVHQAYLREYLERVLLPDPSYAEGRISSIYYDTPSLELYHEKRASEYLKTKVRLRWYRLIEGASEDHEQCYLEVKAKVGGTRKKTRHPMSVAKSALLSRDLSAPVLQAAPNVLLELGYELPRPLVPMVLVQYERRRYVHPFAPVRVALDTQICSPAVNQAFVPAVPPAFVETCVLEVKGPGRELPDWMAPVRRYVQRDAFSKYASCLEHLLQPTGRRE